MGIAEVAVPGVEADDVIGTLSVRAVQQAFFVGIVSPDKVRGPLPPSLPHSVTGPHARHGRVAHRGGVGVVSERESVSVCV
jgi:hypothetical protein